MEQATGLVLERLASPAVSIVICNYNYAAFVREAVASALAQSAPCQVIVVDDGSTDRSRDVLAAIDPSVEVVYQSNGGQLEAYHAGLARCSGDIVIFLDADDALLPGAAALLRTCFDAGVAKVHFRMALVDEDGRALGGMVPTTLVSGDVLTDLVRHGLLYPSAPGSGNAYRRSVLERLFPLPVDAADRVGADFFTIYGSVAFGTVVACAQVLGRYRLHRRATMPGDDLVFGNAALGNDEATKVGARYARLGPWLANRTSGAVLIAPALLDFSVQKSVFATTVLSRSYARGVFASGDVLVPLLRSVWLQRAYGSKKRIGLSLWAFLVMLAPRRAAFRLARHVCNPASRSA